VLVDCQARVLVLVVVIFRNNPRCGARFWVLMLISLAAIPLALTLRTVKLGEHAPGYTEGDGRRLIGSCWICLH